MAHIHSPIPTLTIEQIARFWSCVKIGTKDECWPWVGIPGKGRPRTRFDTHPKTSICGKPLLGASRVAYFIATAVDPGQLLICHSCDNPPCCNPNHLFPGTYSANVRDSVAKGRHPGRPPVMRGSANPAARLVEQDVLEMRRLYAEGKVSYPDLARRFNISLYAAWAVVTRRTWKHLGS